MSAMPFFYTSSKAGRKHPSKIITVNFFVTFLFEVIISGGRTFFTINRIM